MAGDGGARKRPRPSSCSESSRFAHGASSRCSTAAGVEPGPSLRRFIGSSEEEDGDVQLSLQAGRPGSGEEEDGDDASAAVLVFGDEATADVIVHLEDQDSDSSQQVLHLHSRVLLAKSRYFGALLSGRWNEGSAETDAVAGGKMHVRVRMSQPLEAYITTLRLMYAAKGASEATSSVQAALAILPVAAELLYDECLSACLRYVEAVPWSREEEKQVAAVVGYLQLGQQSSDLLARLSPVEPGAVEKMLGELVHAATHTHQHAASVKAFVAKVLSSHHARDVVGRVLEAAFRSGLQVVKDSVEDYSSPNCRGRHDEIEALQRQSLHTAVVSGRHLLWLAERMVELGVAEAAVLEWSEQSGFTANLKRAFMDDVWRNNVPGLPAVLLRCTWRLATAMASGAVLVHRDVRKKLVRDWLPVLVTSKENAVSANCNKQVHLDLEEVFLKLILTLPVSDAHELLQQCLSFASRSADDSSHLSLAFATWFRRATAAQPAALDAGSAGDGARTRG